jgi:hypothetical protein
VAIEDGPVDQTMQCADQTVLEEIAHRPSPSLAQPSCHPLVLAQSYSGCLTLA